MGLLAADLRALANVVLRPDGRRLLAGHGLALLMLAAMSWMLGRATLEYPELGMMIIGRDSSEALRSLLGSALTPCAACAGWLGIGQFERQLFEAPELPLWRSAPHGPLAAPVQALLRTLFATLLWSLALAAPFALLLLHAVQAPWPAYALLVPLMALSVLPMLCSLGAVELVLTAFFAGRVLRLLLTTLTTLAAVGFSLFLLTQMTQQPEAHAERLAADPARAPWTIDAAAQALAMLCGQRGRLADLWPAAAWLLGTGVLFLVAARLHPRAVEAYHRAQRLGERRRRTGWPERLVASLRRKELAQLLQQPSQLFGMLVFGVMVFVLAQQKVFVHGILDAPGLPPMVTQVTAMLALWFVAVLLVLNAHMGRLVLWEGRQWPLLLAAPAAPHLLLRGKLQAIFLLLLWPIAVVAMVGHRMFGAEGPTLLWFAGFALAGNVVSLGVVAAVGTLPLLMRPDASGQIQGSWRSFLAFLTLVMAFYVAVLPGLMAWSWLTVLVVRKAPLSEAMAQQWAPWLLLLVWAIALLLGGSGVWLGGRNFRRLLRPR